MQVESTKLDGVLLITPDVFRDHRGSYTETYNLEEYTKTGIPQVFVQDDISTSKHHVLRGLHGDGYTWKLVSCPMGAVWLAVVNWDEHSIQYKQSEVFYLESIHSKQVLIPPRFGNGHLIDTDFAIFHYKQTTYYNQYPQFTIPYNDPELNIDWPIELGNPPITSERDRAV